MTVLETLLEVQERDTTLDQLAHQRANLPARAELADVEARLAEIDAAIAETSGRAEAAGAQQAELEAELATVESRIAELERKMYGGEVTATRDLMAMTEEVNSLRARAGGIEERALEAMELREQIEEELASLRARRRDVEADESTARAALADAEAEIDQQASVEKEARDGLASGLPPDLSAEYQRLRAKYGGIGAAKLVGSSCSGCHLTLPATELDRMKRLGPGEFVHCDQCGRILVP